MTPPARQPRRLSRRHLVAGVLIAYLAVIAWGVFGPSPGDEIQKAGRGAQKLAEEIGSAVPGRQEAVEDPPAGHDGNRLLGSIRTEAVANVAMFIPLGILFPLLFPSRRWWAVPAGAAVSATIEGIQLVFLSWRSPSLDDVALNTLGTLIGFTLWLLAATLWPPQSGRTSAATLDSTPLTKRPESSVE